MSFGDDLMKEPITADKPAIHKKAEKKLFSFSNFIGSNTSAQEDFKEALLAYDNGNFKLGTASAVKTNNDINNVRVNSVVGNSIDWVKLFNKNVDNKQGIKNEFFNKHDYLTITPKIKKTKGLEVAKLEAIIHTYLSSVLPRVIGKMFYLKHSDAKIDFLNNKIIYPKSQLKLSKELRKFLLNGYKPEFVEKVLQSLSTVGGKKVDSTVRIIGSVLPNHFLQQSYGSSGDSCHQEVKHPKKGDVNKQAFGRQEYSNLPGLSSSLDGTSSIILISSSLKYLYNNRVMIYTNKKTKTYSFGRFYPHPPKEKWLVDEILKIKDYIESKGYKRVIGPTHQPESTSLLYGGKATPNFPFKWIVGHQDRINIYPDFRNKIISTTDLNSLVGTPENILVKEVFNVS